MNMRHGVGLCVFVATIAWSLPIPALWSYYLQIAAGLAVPVLGVISISNDYRKNPEATQKMLVQVLIPLIVVGGVIALLIRVFYAIYP